MLKALELLGFKSFPDKTRFEFPPGITVVVGPNGSGKSNIVDAIKWVLGEQSARSLRGKEMADVIFKGSAHGKRKPANTAQATIIFDNSTGLLPLDDAEVHVTRRVYRSGEGEYLINGESCRLRDIKDLFRGTGVGTDAYSIIEQGKVDSLLRASPKDRRAIFEEAAGISRFKAKKVEAQRRLERVEQNLLRLSDIVDEVETRLKRVRSQASKANRYKEYTDRLQSLRTQVGRVDWQRYSEKLAVVDGQMSLLTEQTESASAGLEAQEAKALANETEMTVAEESLRSCEARGSRARERRAACESIIAQQKSITIELESEVERNRKRLAAMNLRAGDLFSQVREVTMALQQANDSSLEERQSLQEHLERRAALADRVQQSRREAETKRTEFVAQMRQAADLGNRITAHESQLESSQSAIERTQAALAQTTEELAAAESKLAQRQCAAKEKREKLENVTSECDKIQSQLAENESDRERSTRELAQLKERQAALVARASVLHEIEQRMEGIGSGVKWVLDRTRAGDPVYAGVRGMVADIVQVCNPDHALLVEVALGQRAEHLVVAGQHLFEHLERHPVEFPGRVGFLRLQSTPPPSTSAMVDLDGQAGVIGRADRFVQTTSEYEHLVSWLLRDTWFVESISDAIQFNRSISAPIRLVARHGELLDRDGRLVVGPMDAGTGIISRRSELRQVNEHAKRLKHEIKRREMQLANLGQQLDQRLTVSKQLTANRQSLFEEVAKLDSQASSVNDQVAQLRANRQRASEACDQSQTSLGDVDGLLVAGREQLVVVENVIKGLESTLADDRSRLNDMEEELDQRQSEVTDWEVIVAKSEQQLDALQTQCDQLQRDQDERNEAISAAKAELQRGRKRQQDADLQVLSARSESSELALVDEHSQRESEALLTRRNELRAAKSSFTSQVNSLRERIRDAEQKQHSHQLEAERLRHQRDTLAARLKEDYGISTAELGVALTGEEAAAREEVDAEIESLRRKISNLGAVNMDALDDLNDLETRFESLRTQYDDLIEAKESLQRIITKINADSRRLFAETLEAIRENFGHLFRQVFGGGRADIVLEDDVDILESGIDIIATPPGKHSLGLSLLSGGERALTAVTLLLAIFQYRPSPFCVLDEVDGPLDEANIGRFIDVLRDFLKWTKFVVVTHSKRTMTAANTLYGITMQESGVSKRVAVRFEDVSEGGEISSAAIRRSERPESSDSADGDDERGAA
jgi:chromosome segregation protein